MTFTTSPPQVAIIGAGLAGAACAAGLQQAGLQVQLFDKSRGVGGRMATRRQHLEQADGHTLELAFDHGAPHIGALRPRFRSVLGRAEAAGVLKRWTPLVYSAWPAARRELWVPQGGMPALARHLIGTAPVLTGHTVQRLQRSPAGWLLHTAEGTVHGPYAQLVLALPPAQAAALLQPVHPAWAQALAAQPMAPCWTLMAQTAAVDWAWDAAEPEHGPIARVTRPDRVPGRHAVPGQASWVVQATAAWSAEHLEDSPESVMQVLQRALQSLLPGSRAPQWLHSSVHRWRYAQPAAALQAADTRSCWWDAQLGLGVCGDALGQAEMAGLSGVEAAWHSGDELADTVQAWLDAPQAEAEAAASLAAEAEAGLSLHDQASASSPAAARRRPARSSSRSGLRDASPDTAKLLATAANAGAVPASPLQAAA